MNTASLFFSPKHYLLFSRLYGLKFCMQINCILTKLRRLKLWGPVIMPRRVEYKVMSYDDDMVFSQCEESARACISGDH